VISIATVYTSFALSHHLSKGYEPSNSPDERLAWHFPTLEERSTPSPLDNLLSASSIKEIKDHLVRNPFLWSIPILSLDFLAMQQPGKS